MTDQPEPVFLGSAELDRTVGLVLELAAQLHVERRRRMVLEAALRARRLLDDSDLQQADADAGVDEAVARALDEAQRHLLDVLTERNDARGPLRDESAGADRHDKGAS